MCKVNAFERICSSFFRIHEWTEYIFNRNVKIYLIRLHSIIQVNKYSIPNEQAEKAGIILKT